jgi:hypothetical protein
MAKQSIRKRVRSTEESSFLNLEARIALIDEFDEKCAQAIAVAGLLMKADVDEEVTNSAWAIHDLIRRASIVARQLFSITNSPKVAR